MKETLNKKPIEILEGTANLQKFTWIKGDTKYLLELKGHRINKETGEIKERLTTFIYEVSEDALDDILILAETDREKKSINQINSFIIWYEFIDPETNETKKKGPESRLIKPILFFKPENND